MLRTDMTQKQYSASKRNDMVSELLLEHSSTDPSYVIKTMMKIIKTKSMNGMNEETRTQFSKIADAIVRMAEEIKA